MDIIPQHFHDVYVIECVLVCMVILQHQIVYYDMFLL